MLNASPSFSETEITLPHAPRVVFLNPGEPVDRGKGMLYGVIPMSTSQKRPKAPLMKYSEPRVIQMILVE